MTHWLKAGTALAEYPGLVASSCVEAHKYLNSSVGDPTLSSTLGTNTCGAHTSMQTNAHTHKIKINKSKK